MITELFVEHRATEKGSTITRRFTRQGSPTTPVTLYGVLIPISILPRDTDITGLNVVDDPKQGGRRYLANAIIKVEGDEKAGDNVQIIAGTKVLRTFSHADMGGFLEGEHDYGIPIAMQEKSGAIFQGHVTLPEFHNDPPIRFGSTVFRRSQFTRPVEPTPEAAPQS